MAIMTEVRMTKKDAVALLVACGMKAADKFSLSELQKRVNGLPDIEDQIDKKVLKGKHPDEYKLFKDVMRAADNDELVIVTEGKDKGKAKDEKPAKGKKSSRPTDDDDEDGDDTEAEDSDDEDESDDDSDDEESDEDEGDDSDTEDEEEEVTVTKTKPGKDKKAKDAKAKSKDKTKPEKEKKSRSEPVGTDRWGCRLGTRAARLNAVISKSPKSAAEIADEAEYDKPIGGHLRFLMAKGFIVKTDDNKYREKPTGDKAGKKVKK